MPPADNDPIMDSSDIEEAYYHSTGEDENIYDTRHVSADDQSASEDEDRVDQDQHMSEEQAIFEDDSCQCFYGHNDQPIYCLATSGSLVLSGGGDDLCLLWDSNTGEVVCSEAFSQVRFLDSVSAVAFSHNSEFCAAGSLSGQVATWRLAGETIHFLGFLDGPPEINSLKFHPKGNVLLASGEDGTIWLWSIPSGNCISVLSTDSFSILNASFYPVFGKNIVSASAEGSVKIWDPKTGLVLARYDAGSPPHTISLYESANDGRRLIIAGCEDGRVCILHGTSGNLLNERTDVHEDSVEVVLFVEKGSNQFVISGCLGGRLAILEMPSLNLRHICNHPSAITSLKSITTDDMFIAITGSTDGMIRIWDILSGSLVHTLKGHQDTILDIAYIESKNQIVTASDDGCCLVFNLNN